jgi:hypothetical protein
VSGRKVVPTLTSKSAKIYLSMAGVEQHNDTGLSLTRVYPGSGRGPYIQQGCAQGAVLRCTVVLAERELQARRERRRSLRVRKV